MNNMAKAAMEAIKHYASLPFADMDTCNLCGNYDTIQCWIDIADGVFLHVCEECANSKTKRQLVNQLKKKYGYQEKKRG